MDCRNPLDKGELPLHAAAVPDADRDALKRPEDAARELVAECGYLMDAAEQDAGSNEVRHFCQRCGRWVIKQHLRSGF